MKKLYSIFLVASLICSCSSSKELSEELPELPVTRFERQYFPDLPYKDIVKAIHANRPSVNSNNSIRQKFKDYTHEINKTILDAVLDIGNVPEEKKAEAIFLFDTKKDSLTEIINTNFKTELLDPKYLERQNILIKYDVSLSVDGFSNIMSERICSIINIATTLSGIGIVYKISSGLLCETVLAKLLMPIIEELKNQALILDYVNAEIRITEHIRELIFEVATVQDRIKAEFYSEPTRKILWVFTSSGKLDLKAWTTIKAGFDLKENFDIKFSEQDKILYVNLPKAKILSNEFNFNIDKMEDGWFIEIGKEQINQAMRELKYRLRKEAIQTGILQRAEKHAELLISSLLRPLLENERFSFKTEIKFNE